MKSKTFFFVTSDCSDQMHWISETIKLPIGKNNWEVDTYRNKLKNCFFLNQKHFVKAIKKDFSENIIKYLKCKNGLNAAKIVMKKIVMYVI